MRLADFDFELPAERIAQRPASRRDGSRLLLLDRRSGAIEHRRFGDLAGQLAAGDLLVLNDARVIPARLIGRKASGGRVELLLVERQGEPGAEELWRCLLRAARPPQVGSWIELGQGLRAQLVGRDAAGCRVRLVAPGGAVEPWLERVGRTPLPPYIHREDGEPDQSDRERYQTVFARHAGAVAAPTAGLHFTEELFEALAAARIERAFLTLHVGPGTFLPLRGEVVEEQRLAPERFELRESVAAAVRAARERGGRVVAVGTTVVRALESSAAGGGLVRAQSGACDLFIRPGFRFRVVDALITNFHLPRSTLLLLVAAFAGRETVLAAYREALRCGYRFYSYGDAMLVSGAV